MIIGVPKEIKNKQRPCRNDPCRSSRVGEEGHTVYVQATAGANSGFF